MGSKDSSLSSSSSIFDSLGDDASSSSSSSTTTCNNASSNGPLYELADLMAQLPINRGLSKFYNGKSKTFGSLSNVKSVEDLGKGEMISYNSRMKSCKSYGRNLNVNTTNIIHHKFSPKPTIAKRSTTKTKPSSCLSPSSFATKPSFFIHG